MPLLEVNGIQPWGTFSELSKMNNGTAPALQGQLLLVTQFYLVTSTTVAGTLYGIAFTLFCLYVHSLVPRFQDANRKRQAKIMLGFSTVLMLGGLYDLVADAWGTQDAYIKHNNYAGGPVAYILSTYHTSPVAMTGNVCHVAIDFLTSTIQVHFVFLQSIQQTG
jgi:hypothetical protein